MITLLRYLKALSPKEPQTDDDNQTSRGDREEQIEAPAERLQHCGEDDALASCRCNGPNQIRGERNWLWHFVTGKKPEKY